MSGLRAVVVRPVIIAAFVLALLASLAVGLTLSGSGNAPPAGNSSVTEIELQSHNGPGKHKRCKPKGKYGKPKKPKKCRRRP